MGRRRHASAERRLHCRILRMGKSRPELRTGAKLELGPDAAHLVRLADGPEPVPYLTFFFVFLLLPLIAVFVEALQGNNATSYRIK